MKRFFALKYMAVAVLFAVMGAGAWGQNRMPANTNAYLIAAYRGTNNTGGDYYGDKDKITVIFFEVDDTLTQPLYFGVYDPGIDASDDTVITPNAGDMDYRVYGGSGAYTNSSSRALTFASPSSACAGTLLDELSIAGTVSANAAYNDQWVYSSAILPSQGEHIGNKYIFKYVVITAQNPATGSYTDQDDNFINKYQVAVSLSNSGSPATVSNVRAFAYSLCVSLEGTVASGVTWDLYPFVPTGTGTSYYIRPESYDGDYRTGNSNATTSGFSWLLSPWDGTAYVSTTPINISDDSVNTPGPGQASGATNGVQVPNISCAGKTWHFQMLGGRETGANEPNGVDIWAASDTSNSDLSTTTTINSGTGTPLRIYTAEYSAPAVDHAILTPTNQSLTASGTATVSLQFVDSTGEAVPYSGKVRVTASTTTVSMTGGTAIGGNSYDKTYTTDGDSGLITFTLSDTSTETVTLAVNTDGIGGYSDNIGPGTDVGAIVDFQTDPEPVVSSSANLSFKENIGSTKALPNIVVTDAGSVNINSTNNLSVILPATLGASFAPAVLTVTASGANTGSYAVSYTNSNKTAVITIPATFAAGTTTFSGLLLANSYSVSSGSLGIAWNGSTTSTQATDDKVITIQSQYTTYVWQGGTAGNLTTWSTNTNWVGGTAPSTTTDNIVIPAGLTYYPAIPGGTTINNLTVGTGTSLTVSGGTLTVSGAISNSGSITISDSSTIAVTGNLETGSGAMLALGSGTMTVGGTVTVSGATSIGGSIASTGKMTFNAPVTLTADATFDTSASDAQIAFNSAGTVNGAHKLTVNSGTGSKTFAAAFGGSSGLQAFTVSGTGPATLSAASYKATGNTTTFNSPVVISANQTIQDAGEIIFNSTLTVNTGITLTLQGLDVDFNGGASSITGTGANIILEPYTASAGVYLGAAADAGSRLDINATDWTRLTETSFSSIALGTSSDTVYVVNSMTLSYPPTIAGNLEIYAGTTTLATDIAVGGMVTVDAGQTMDLVANSVTGATAFKNYGTVKISGGSQTISGTKTNGPLSAVVYYGAGSATMNWGTAYQDLTIDSTATGDFTAAAPLQAEGNVAVNAIGYKLTLSNYLGTQYILGNVSGAGTLDASAIASGNILSVGGYVGTSGNTLAVLRAPAGTLKVGTNWDIGTTFTANSGTVEFTATGTVYSSDAFYNLAKSTTGATTFNAGTIISVAKNLVISAGTLKLANYAGTQTISGNVSGAGTLDASAIASSNILSVGGSVGTSGTPLAYFTAPAGTVSVAGDWYVTNLTSSNGTAVFTNTGSIGTANTFSNVEINASGKTVSLGADISTQCAAADNGGNITISAGTLDANGKNITLDGDWSNTPGTTGFACGSGTVTFSNATDTTHSITGNTTFYNFTSTTTTTPASITFATGSQTTISTGGTFTITGVSGKLLSLTGAGTWTLDMIGSASVDYAYIKYSDAYTNNISPTNSTSGGYNDLVDTSNRWLLATTYTWNGSDGTNPTYWSVGANWTPTAPTGGPSALDTVTIPAPLTNYPVLDTGALATVTVDTLAIQSGSSLDLQGHNLSATTATKASGATLRLQGGETTVSPAALLTAGTTEYTGTASYNLPAQTYTIFVISGSGTYTMTGAVTAGTSFSQTNGTLKTGANTLTLSGTTNTISGGTLTVESSGSVSAGSNPFSVTTTGAMALTGGTLTAGTVSVSNSSGTGTILSASAASIVNATVITISGTAGKVDISNITFNLTGATDWSDSAFAGTWNAPTSGTINFNGATTPSIATSGTHALYDIVIADASGAVSLATTMKAHNLTVGSTASPSLTATGDNAITVTGSVSGTGSLNVSNFAAGTILSVDGGWNIAGFTSGASSTVSFTGAAGTGPFTITPNGQNFRNLTINASGKTYKLGGDLSVLGDLAISAGTLDVTTSNHAITLGGNFTLAAPVDFSAQSGTFTFNGTGAQTASSATFYAVVGNKTAGSVAFTAPTMQSFATGASKAFAVSLLSGGSIANAAIFDNVPGAGPGLTIDSGFTFSNGATATTSTKSIKGAIVATASNLDFGTTTTTLTGDASLSASAGAGYATLGTVSGSGYSLGLTGGTGGSSVTGDIGTSVSRLKSVTLSSGGTLSVQSVFTSQAQSYTAATATTMNGTYSSNDGEPATGYGISFTGPVLLGANVSVSTTGTNAGDSITFSASSTVNNTKTLTLNAGSSGSISLGAAIGGTTPVTSITLTANTADLQAVKTDNGQSYSSVTTTTLNNTLTVTTAGYGVTAGNVLLGTSGGTITLSATSNTANDVTLGTVDNAKALNITATGGDIILGAVGAATPVTSITLTANTASLQAVTTTSAQDYSAVTTTTLNGTLTVKAAGAGVSAKNVSIAPGGGIISLTGINADNDISFTGTIDAATAGSQGLTLTAEGGDISFSAAVGGSKALSGISVTTANTVDFQSTVKTDSSGIDITATTTTVSGDVSTTNSATAGPFSVTGALTTNGARTISTNSTTTDANINVTGTVTATTGELTLDSGSADITMSAAANNFGTVKITSAYNATFRDANGIILDTSTITHNLSVTAGGNISDSGTLTVTGLASMETWNTAGTSTIILTNASSNFGSLSLQTLDNTGSATVAGQISVKENSGTDLALVKSADSTNGVTITSAGAVTDSGAITASKLIITSTGGATLDFATNAIQDIHITNSTSGVVTVTGNTATTLTVEGILNTGATAGAVTVSSTGNINITGAVSPLAGQAVSITALGSGNTITTSAMVGATTLAGNVSLTADDLAIGADVQTASGVITLQQTTATRVIDVGNASGGSHLDLSSTELAYMKAASGTLRIGNVSNTGGIIVSAAVPIPNIPTVRLETSASIAKTGSGTAIGTAGTTRLCLIAATGIDVETKVSSIAASNATSGGITISDDRGSASNIAIATVDGSSGLTASGQTITFAETTGGVTVSQNISTTAGSGTISLSSAETMTQGATTPGAIFCKYVLLLGAGTKTLTSTSNDADTLAANLTGGASLSYDDTNDITVGTVLTTDGITVTGSANVTLTPNTLAITKNISSGSGTITLNPDSGSINLGASVTSANGPITCSDPILLTADSTINTNAASGTGDITLSGAVDGGASHFNLTLETGSGISGADINASAMIGSTNAIGTLTVQNVGGTAYFDKGITAGTLTVPNTAKNISINGAAGSQTSTITNSVTFNNSGTLTLGNESGDVINFNGGVTGSAGDTTTLYGTAYSTEDDITFGAVTLGGSVTISTQPSAGLGQISLGTVTGGSYDLTLIAGSAIIQSAAWTSTGTLTATTKKAGGAPITLTSANDVATINLAALNAAGSALDAGAISWSSANGFAIGASNIKTAGNTYLSAGGTVTETGCILASGLNLAGAGSYALTSTANDITTLAANLSGSGKALSYTDANAFSVGTVTAVGITTNDGNVTLKTDATATGITISNAISSGAGTVSIDTGTSGTGGNISLSVPSAITTSGSDITFSDPVNVAANTTISTTAGTGNIVFSSTLDGAKTLSLTAAGGNITFSGAVGSLTEISALTVNSAKDVTATTIMAGSLTQSAGTGTTTLSGLVTISGAPGVSLTGKNFIIGSEGLSGGITDNNASGSISITHTGFLTIHDRDGASDTATFDIVAPAGFAESGAGGTVDISGDIQTTNTAISFSNAVREIGDVKLTSGAGAGNITFASGLTRDASARKLDLTAGTGSIVLPSAQSIGSSSAYLDSVTINSAANVAGDAGATTSAGAMYAASITQTTGTGLTYLDAVTTSGAISITTHAIHLAGAAHTGGAVTLSATTGSLATTAITIDAAGDIISDGTVSLTSDAASVSGINTSGDITTKSAAITFNSATTLTGDIALSSIATGTGANISLLEGATRDGTARSLDLYAGTAGSILVPRTKTLGTASLNAVTIHSANNVAEDSAATYHFGAVNAASFTQSAGTGTSYFGSLNTTGDININTNYVRFGADVTSTAGSIATTAATGTVINPLTGDLTISATAASKTIAFNTGATYIDSAFNVTFSAGASMATQNFHIYAPTKIVSINPALTAKNLVKYAGTLAFNGNSVTTTGDLVLFGNSYEPDDLTLGVAGLFTYDNAARTTNDPLGKLADPGVGLISAMPLTATTIAAYSGNITGLGNAVVAVNGNFYDNGADISGSAPNWTLKLAANDSAAASFAEAYYCHFYYCKVGTASTDGWLAAAENAYIDPGMPYYCPASNYDTTRPDFLPGTTFSVDTGSVVQNTTIATGSTLSGTYTVYDDVIRVEFYDGSATPTSSNIKLIENTNDEIHTAVAAIKTDNGTALFAEAYKDAACTIPTTNHTTPNENGELVDLSVFYLKTLSARWNTNATGSSFGVSSANTDRGRVGTAPAHQVVTPNITVAKATSTLYQTLRDNHKNRIANHETPALSFKNVADRCRPVIIGVKAGQELHVDDPKNHVANYYPWDGHNYLEITWSEPVSIGVLTTSSYNVRSTYDFTSGSVWGGDTRMSGSDLFVSGYFTAVKSGLALSMGVRNSNPIVASSQPSGSDANTSNGLYRAFMENTQQTDLNGNTSIELPTPTQHDNKLRIYLAGFALDISGTAAYSNYSWKYFWPGYIDSIVDPSGATVNAVANAYIRDLATHTNAIESASSYDVDATTAIAGSYGSSNYAKGVITVATATATAALPATNVPITRPWDTTPPDIARYRVFDTSKWNAAAEYYEMCPEDTNGDGYVDRIEMHMFDDTPAYDPTDLYEWASRRGWYDKDYTTASAVTKAVPDIGVHFMTSGENGEIRGGIRAGSMLAGISGPTVTMTTGAFSFGTSSSTMMNTHSISFGTAITDNLLNPSGPVNVLEDPYFTIYTAPTTVSASDLVWRISDTLYVNYDQYSGFVTDLAGLRLKSFSDRKCIDRTAPKMTFTIQPLGDKALYLVFSKPIAYTSLQSALQILDASGTNLIDATVAPTSTQSATDIAAGFSKDAILKLNRSVSLSELLTLTVKPIPITIVDTETSTTLNVSNIADAMGNRMAKDESHRLTDIGINVVNPLYASDGINTDGTFGEGEGALRTFDGTGRLLDKDITIASKINPGTGTATATTSTLQLYYDVNPSSSLYPTVYNDWLGKSLTLWLPSVLPSFNSAADLAARSLSPNVITDTNQSFRNFILPSNDDEIVTGAKVEFLFKYGDLYCARLKDATDITSVDPWRFSISALKSQRGGVTILNNVIDSNKREKTLLNVVMSKSGSLVIQIFTMDGNVVRTLERGKKGAGTYTYSWDGTNLAGNPVARGIYFIRVIGPDMDEIRKVMVVKE